MFSGFMVRKCQAQNQCLDCRCRRHSPRGWTRGDYPHGQDNHVLHLPPSQPRDQAVYQSKTKHTSSTRTRRGGSCLRDIYKTFLIYRTCMRRAPAKPVRACILRKWCPVSHVTFEAPLRTSRFTLHTSNSTLHTSHCTLPTAHSTLHSPHFTLHSPHFTLHTPHFTLHSSRPTLHTAPFTLHTSSHLSSSHLIPAHLFSSHLFSYVI